MLRCYVLIIHSNCFVVIVGTGAIFGLYGVGVYGVHAVLWCWCVVFVLCCVVLCWCWGVRVLGC